MKPAPPKVACIRYRLDESLVSPSNGLKSVRISNPEPPLKKSALRLTLYHRVGTVALRHTHTGLNFIDRCLFTVAVVIRIRIGRGSGDTDIVRNDASCIGCHMDGQCD